MFFKRLNGKFQLKEGRNELLIKISTSDTSWEWQFNCRMTDTEGRPFDNIRPIIIEADERKKITSPTSVVSSKRKVAFQKDRECKTLPPVDVVALLSNFMNNESIPLSSREVAGCILMQLNVAEGKNFLVQLLDSSTIEIEERLLIASALGYAGVERGLKELMRLSEDEALEEVIREKAKKEIETIKGKEREVKVEDRLRVVTAEREFLEMVLRPCTKGKSVKSTSKKKPGSLNLAARAVLAANALISPIIPNQQAPASAQEAKASAVQVQTTASTSTTGSPTLLHNAVTSAIVASVVAIQPGDSLQLEFGEIEHLPYSDKVIQNFVKMVGGWKDKQGQPVLVLWKQKLAEAKETYKQGKISKVQLAKIEESVAKELSQRIRKEIGSNEKLFDLADVVKHKQAQCLGYSQLVYIVGNSVGLSVRAINVVELTTPGPLPAGYGHITSIVSLIDGKTMIVDLALKIVSKPFKLERELGKVGNYLELKDKENPLGIHRRIQILDKNGLIAAIYTNRGNTYANLGQYTQAISDCTKAIKLNPKFAMAYNNRGNAYYNLNQYTQAISDFTKAIELNPKYAEAYNNRGNAYSNLGQYTEAISEYTKAIELNPKDAKAYSNRGSAYDDLGQHAQAISELTKAIELNPKYAEAYNNRGVAYANVGQRTQAISDFTKAIELNPKDAKAYTNRGVAYADLGQRTQAISDYTKAIELNPKLAEAYYNRGNAYASLGQRTQAISDYTKAIELNPKYAEAYTNRGVAYASLGQYTQAISDFTKAIELNPKFAETYYGRGLAYALLGKFEEARKDLLEAAKLNPTLKPLIKKTSERFKLGLKLNNNPSGSTVDEEKEAGSIPDSSSRDVHKDNNGGTTGSPTLLHNAVTSAIVASVVAIQPGDSLQLEFGEIEHLPYSDKVIQNFVKMVGGWKDKQGQPVLVLWKQKLAEAKETYKQGKISKVQLAKIEESVAKELSQRIRKEISYNEKFFDLADVVKNKQAQCISYSQLVYILGNSVGLSVRAINVVELTIGALPTGSGHTASIVSLTDGKTMMVDLAQMPTPMTSKPFELEKEFTKVGNYWELKDKENPLRIHRRIQILDKNGLIAAIYNNRGNVYFKLGQFLKAISDYNKAIELNPKLAEAYYNRGNAYVNLGQFTKAISDLTKTIELNLKYAEAYYSRGNAYVKLGQHTRAISDFNKATELNPKYGEAYYSRGNVYVNLSQFTKAISDLSKAIELNPKYAKAYYNRGVAYGKLGQHTRAISDYTKATELNPKFAEAYNNRGNVYDDLGQFTKAISDLTKAIELNLKYAEAYYNRGHVYGNLGQFTKAISDLTKAIELNPKFADAYNNRGLFYAILGKSKEAKKDLLKAVELNSALKLLVKKISDHFKLGLNLNNPSGPKVDEEKEPDSIPDSSSRDVHKDNNG